MAKHQYSPKNFFRQAPNVLLDRYFHERALLTELDIASLPETDVERPYRAWLALPASDRARTEEDFRLIDSLADEQGVVAILEEALFHEEDLETVFAKMGGFHDKALWTFLERPRYLQIAARFRESDQLPRRCWRDRDGMPGIKPRDDDAACKDLANVVRPYFREKEGRGHSCHVDVFRRGPTYYYFCYPEDHSRTVMEFEGQNQLQRRVHRPVFEVVFVYDPENGMLSVYFEGRASVARDLLMLFARQILVTNLPNPRRDQRVYELNPLKDRGFAFQYTPASGILDVRVRQLRLTLVGGASKSITLEADPSDNRMAVYDLLDEVLNTADPSSTRNRIPLSMVNITRVGLRACFSVDGTHERSVRNFTVSFPNSCSLKHEGKDLVLRKMLIDSGIEPHVPGQSAQVE